MSKRPIQPTWNLPTCETCGTRLRHYRSRFCPHHQPKFRGRRPQAFRELHRQMWLGENNPRWSGGPEAAKERGKERKRFLTRQRLARLQQAPGSHTFGEWLALKRAYLYRCAACIRPESEVGLTQDHIQPVSRGGSNFIRNIQPLCGWCNSRKHVQTVDYAARRAA